MCVGTNGFTATAAGAALGAAEALVDADALAPLLALALALVDAALLGFDEPESAAGSGFDAGSLHAVQSNAAPNTLRQKEAVTSAPRFIMERFYHVPRLLQ